MSTDQIINELKKKIFRPVYFLQGEEPFYIDQISDYIEKNILSESTDADLLCKALSNDVDSSGRNCEGSAGYEKSDQQRKRKG